MDEVSFKVEEPTVTYSKKRSTDVSIVTTVYHKKTLLWLKLTTPLMSGYRYKYLQKAIWLMYLVHPVNRSSSLLTRPHHFPSLELLTRFRLNVTSHLWSCLKSDQEVSIHNKSIIQRLNDEQGAIHQTKLWLHTWNPFQGPQNLNLMAHKMNLKKTKQKP